MANIKNLERIHEIAESLPKLEEARKLLSQEDSRVFVGETLNRLQGTQVILPKEVRLNILNVINLAINKLKEELKDL